MRKALIVVVALALAVQLALLPWIFLHAVGPLKLQASINVIWAGVLLVLFWKGKVQP